MKSFAPLTPKIYFDVPLIKSYILGSPIQSQAKKLSLNQIFLYLKINLLDLFQAVLESIPTLYTEER